jgi:TetR/AcrR family transcriptional regulator, tetracycline repressor protein
MPGGDMALTREHVVRTAVELLDQVGLEGLTLRRLATELGVQAPTLYWHVKDKHELLDLMAEAILTELTPDRPAQPRPGQPWWDWLAENYRTRYVALLAHRDAALVVAGNRPTEASWPRIEQTIRTLVGVGFTPAEAHRSLAAIGSFVGGCALEEQTMRRRAYLEARRDRPSAPLDPAAYFQLATSTRSRTEAEDRFETGLGLLLTGMRAWLARSAGDPVDAVHS